MSRPRSSRPRGTCSSLALTWPWYAGTGRPSGRATTATAWRSVSRVGSIF
ncbi:hypothetical protein HCN51_37325 [Nonomuraea sp. FMUSA5-5]|uniref:Uncharacterized protein n=1 Tax=Nonomuraea composti TaxID=2720023 RepID=A0ABX1BFA0_9ACTN|nr:hypothetical protein [Nonomuraea sp. FMUSA5-5]NJP95037.1 hypothetical protein [Nonomuraea sp. FMUSA5-5]